LLPTKTRSREVPPTTVLPAVTHGWSSLARLTSSTIAVVDRKLAVRSRRSRPSVPCRIPAYRTPPVVAKPTVMSPVPAKPLPGTTVRSAHVVPPLLET
jgi:hypothetical protein